MKITRIHHHSPWVMMVTMVIDALVLLAPGLPYSFYHGRTGIVFNVNRNALGALAARVTMDHSYQPLGAQMSWNGIYGGFSK